MDASHTVDSFGFTEYGVVLHAGEAQLAAVRAFRRNVGLRRAMYEAHVTVKGTFRGVNDLRAVRKVVEGTAKHVLPFVVELAGAPYEVTGNGLLVPVYLSASLEELHRCLKEGLEHLSDDAYQMPAFCPHLTLCYGCTHEQLAKAKRFAAGVYAYLGPGFTACSLDLMARTGDPLHGGYCTLIDSFPLGCAGARPELCAFYRTLPSQRQVHGPGSAGSPA